MPIFGPKANMFMNAALIAVAGLVAVLLILVWVVPVMGYNTQESYSPQQPVPFSHQHHVSGLGLDCRYCHTSGRNLAERGDTADGDLHDLPLADLDQCGDPGAGAAKLRRGQAAALDRASTHCRITSTSTTASISRRASGAPNATERSATWR